MDDALIEFAEEESVAPDSRATDEPWKVMVIDDEKSIHDITGLSLKEFSYDGHGIRIIDAYSAKEARACLVNHPDTALMLVDVVMESEDAGLKLVEYVRRELKNDLVQVVIRTGQPGFAPEDQVVSEYRINAYYSKTDVTSRKLVNLVTTSLRTFQLALALSKELTRRKRAEEALLKLNHHLEAKIAERTQALYRANQMKSQFLANMSHEIRTPMNGIIAMANMLMEEVLSERQKEFASIIQSSATTLLTLINDILDLSKIEAGRLDFETRAFSVRRLIRETLAMFKSKADEKGLGLESSVDRELPEVLAGDEVRIKQILLNLVGNAVKFTDSGRISVRAFLKENLEDAVRMGLTVTDTGPGIDPEFLPQLFDKFSQQDSSTTRKFGGTGLGLAISKQLSFLMGGGIQARNRAGNGAVFEVELRVQKSSLSHGDGAGRYENDEAVALLRKKISAMGLKILVAEDNPINQRVISLLLEKMNQTPDVVENGHEVLNKLATSRYDILLMDVQMPVMDGLETTRAIRDPNGPVACKKIPIVALTALAMPKDAKACIDAGMDHVLTKPIHPRELVMMLAQIFGL